MSIASELNKLVQIFKNWTPTVSIPPATADTLGGVKVGDGLEVTEDGTLSATGGGGDEPIVITMILTGTAADTIESTMDPTDLLDLYEDDPIQFRRVIIRVVSTMVSDEYDAVMIPESVTYTNNSVESRRLQFDFGEGMTFSCDDEGFHQPD